MNDITVTIAIDAKTLPMLQVAMPTWRRHWPELFEWPWLIIHDPAVDPKAVDVAGASCVAWAPHTDYPSQRARMLAAFVYAAPRHVQTKWWMKIDCDVVARCRDERWRQHWPDTNELSSELSAFVGAAWSYTKPKGDGRTAAEWCEALESFGDAAIGGERLGLASRINGRRIQYPRMASWISFYRTEWTKTMAALAAWHCGPDQMPVASQDTYHWYCAARRCDPFRVVRWKHFGWTNEPKMRKLEATARVALEAGMDAWSETS